MRYAYDVHARYERTADSGVVRSNAVGLLASISFVTLISTGTAPMPCPRDALASILAFVAGEPEGTPVEQPASARSAKQPAQHSPSVHPIDPSHERVRRESRDRAVALTVLAVGRRIPPVAIERGHSVLAPQRASSCHSRGGGHRCPPP